MPNTQAVRFPASDCSLRLFGGQYAALVRRASDRGDGMTLAERPLVCPELGDAANARDNRAAGENMDKREEGDAAPVDRVVSTPGYYWCRGVVSYELQTWKLVEVFVPLWVDPTRKDLRWRYLDRSGGEDSRYDVNRGEWRHVTPPSC